MYAKVRNMSAHVEEFNNNVVTTAGETIHVSGLGLWSYNSLVAVYDVRHKKLYMLPRYDYSTTTSKHVHAFIQDYTVIDDESYKDIRKSFKDENSDFVECSAWNNGVKDFYY